MILEDYWARKRMELGLERGEVLAEVQRVLDGWYPGKARARSFNRGVLRIVTVSAAVAGELRMRQVEVAGLVKGVERVAIGVGQIGD